MLDRYIDTRVERISPEAPVPVAKAVKRWSALGGAANVARNLASIGVKVTLIGARACDDAGQEIEQLLKEEKINAPGIFFDDRPTTTKCRVLSNGQQLLRLDEEECWPLSQNVRQKLFDAALMAIDAAKVVILSDYGKGVFVYDGDELDDLLTIKIIKYCQSRQIPVLVDPIARDWKRYTGATCLTPNTKELTSAIQMSATDRAFFEMINSQMQDYNFENILWTRGAQGMMLLRGGRAHEIKAEAREVSDVSGAGDTVIAVLAAALAAGFDWVKAAELANTAAGIVVGKLGTSTVTLRELTGKMWFEDSSALRHLKLKLVDRQSLLEIVSEWRKKHYRIVFTNGCFDLLHPGHIKLLQEAATLGDKLIVAINSDLSVKRLKGPDRPIQPQDARVLVMAGLEGVDAVTVFDEDTPLKLIEAVCPDVLVKGGDYTVQDVVGSDFVLGHGGQVHIVDLAKGFSTTGLVSAIQG
ncbi:MAG: D-glycero-beta-D-manno-heptose 1-phosphate adenylyltransferase [Desulfovibrionaceae bacterium]|nr:D-glycero-beta-D-manno-heptose 1-phosphate adenylyltransferase [Desulfovibrionaceae bacterium]